MSCLTLPSLQDLPFPLLFVTIGGAHLYGFASAETRYELSGAHVLPVRDVVGLYPGRETIESSELRDGRHIDLVTQDVKLFFSLMLQRNGAALEHLLSPLVVHTTHEHEELKQIGRQCVTRHHAHHYLDLAQAQWRLFERERPWRVKPLLGLYRVLLTGIHLMRKGSIEANLVRLNEEAKLAYVADLVDRHLAGREQAELEDDELDFHRVEYQRLLAGLEAARDATRLPESTGAGADLNALLVRLRIGG